MDKEIAVKMSKKELRAILFWACVGIRMSLSGSYAEFVADSIKSIATDYSIKLDAPPTFGANFKKKP